MKRRQLTACRWMTAFFAGVIVLAGLSGCPRNQTTLDDRTLENKPHVETEKPVDRADPFRP